MAAPGQLLDAYFMVMQQDPSAIDILNVIRARAQVQEFYDATASYVGPHRHDKYKRTLFLLSNMADACVRLALMHPRSQGTAVVENFKEMVNTQAAKFVVGKTPDGFLLPPGVRAL